MTARHVCIELCIEDVAGVAAATAAGADRVEYCSELHCGGLTPDLAEFHAALDACPAGGMQVLIRSRGGDFVYEQADIDDMVADILRVRASYDAWLELIGAASHGEAQPIGSSGVTSAVPALGFVVGALTAGTDGSVAIDEAAVASFAAAAGPHRLTFHRAFDALPDQAAGLEQLVELGFERVLTTGGHESVANIEGLKSLIAQANGRMEILVSGGLRSNNVAAAVEATGAREIHMRAPYASRPGTDPREARRIVDTVRALSASS